MIHPDEYASHRQDTGDWPDASEWIIRYVWALDSRYQKSWLFSSRFNQVRIYYDARDRKQNLFLGPISKTQSVESRSPGCLYSKWEGTVVDWLSKINFDKQCNVYSNQMKHLPRPTYSTWLLLRHGLPRSGCACVPIALTIATCLVTYVTTNRNTYQRAHGSS